MHAEDDDEPEAQPTKVDRTDIEEARAERAPEAVGRSDDERRRRRASEDDHDDDAGHD